MALLLSNLKVLEQRTMLQAGIPTLTLMENAGQAVVKAIISNPMVRSDKKGVIVCGPGNNGGDGFVVARLLLAKGFKQISVLYTGSSYQGDALANLEQLMGRALPVVNAQTHKEQAVQAIGEADFIVDALFGSGLSRPIEGLNAKLVERMNANVIPSALNPSTVPTLSSDILSVSPEGQQLSTAEEGSDNRINTGKKTIVFAVDVPSGVDSQTGQVLGAAVHADETITFALAKPGLYLQPGKSLRGRLHLSDIGIPSNLINEDDSDTFILTLAKAARCLPPHPPLAHKYTFGHVAVLAGSEAMPGASVLCSESAMRSGAGLVTLLAPKNVFNQIAVMPEVMRHGTEDTSAWTETGMKSVISSWLASKKVHALALGPGLGRDLESIRAVSCFIDFIKSQENAPPVVLDADALFAIAELNSTLNSRFVITPHVGEASRLLGIASSEIGSDLIKAARCLQERYQCHVVLKSASIVAALMPEENHKASYWISPWGNSGMATAGSGDVLTGILASQLGQAYAQKLPLSRGILLGVSLHGLAGDSAAAEVTEYACHASDIDKHLPQAYRSLKAQSKPNL